MSPTCDRMEGIRLKAPPLKGREYRLALDARNLHEAGYSWRTISHAMGMAPDKVERLVQRLEREERDV